MARRVQVLIPKYDVEAVQRFAIIARPISGSAYIYISILNHPRARDCRIVQVRAFNSGSAPCRLKS